MSVPLIIALNVGAAGLLTLILTAMMLLPKRLRAHRHPHLELSRQEAARPTESEHSAPRRRLPIGSGRVVTDP